jgi:hypothetical protein
MKILALDIGKCKTVFVAYDMLDVKKQEYGKIATTPAALHDLLVARRPDRLVLEVGPAAGWVCDLAATLKIPTQVANTNDERWQWKRAKKKTDRMDALKLAQMKQLQTAPCVGPRLSEAVVALLDDPHRFKNARQVGAYVGLTPRQWQSGQSVRDGHISRWGNPLLRALLVEIAWIGVRRKTWMLAVYEQVLRGSPKRKKIAIVAVARRLLIRLWAMLRTGQDWKEAVAAELRVLTTPA